MSSLESKFHADMINIYLTAKKELDYNAARFSQLVSQRGGLGVRHMGLRFFGGTIGWIYLLKLMCSSRNMQNFE